MKTASNKLYDALFEFANQAGSWRDVRHLQVLVWMVIGLLQEGTIHLSAWIDHVDSRAVYAQSTQRRFSRWLHNGRIQAYRAYAPLIRQVLSDWQDPVAYVALDTTMLWDTFCVIRLSLVYRGRAIPLVWRVLRHASSSVSFGRYRRLLQRAATLLPDGVEMVLLGERGFINAPLAHWLPTTLGWHYHLRLKTDCWFCYRGQWRQLKQVHLARGEALFLHHVKLFKRNSLSNVHLALARDPVSGQFWAIVSDRPTTLQTLWDYALRFDIEENFLDDKSNGFQLEASGLRHSQALSRLLLVTAVATLFLTVQGTALVNAQARRWVDTHWHRGLSYLKLGWKWVKQSLSRGRKLFSLFSLTTTRDPQPAIASIQQSEKLLFARTFIIKSPHVLAS